MARKRSRYEIARKILIFWCLFIGVCPADHPAAEKVVCRLRAAKRERKGGPNRKKEAGGAA